MPELNDTMPYYIHKKIDDSISQLIHHKEMYNDGIGSTGYSFGIAGVRKLDADWYSFININWRLTDSVEQQLQKKYDMLNIFLQTATESSIIKKYQDSISMLNKAINKHHIDLYNHRNDGEKSSYFFTLSGYQLKNDRNFFVKDSIYYLSFVVWDSVKGDKMNEVKWGHREYKKVPYRYNSKEKIIMLPLSESKYKALDIGLKVFGFVNLCLAILVMIIFPWRILRNISKGNAFTKDTISAFSNLGISLLILFTANILFRYILQWIYNDVITADFMSEPFINKFIENIWLLLGVGAFFLISNAFKRGYKLQQENALTI